MKKEDIKKYRNTKRGNKIYPTINKLLIDGILCFICSIFLIVATMILKDGVVFYFMAAILICFGIYFIYTSNKIKKLEINRMKNNIKEKEGKQTK